MNKILLLVIILLSTTAKAQLLNIPDINFKNAMLLANPDSEIAKDIDGNNVVIDLNGDGEIQNNEAENIYFLNVSGKNIDDLSGIDAFTNLETLFCSSNNLTYLDVSSLNSTLTFLQCSWNELTIYDPSENTNLTTLAISGNNLMDLDVSSNVNLTYLSCGFNNLSNIDVSQNVNLTRFHITQSPYLTHINLQNGNNTNFIIGIYNYYTNLPNLEVVYVDEVDTFLTDFIEEEAGHSVCFLTDISLTNCDAVGITENEILTFSVYPNPTIHVLNVSTEIRIDFIEIYSELGQLVLQTKSNKSINVQHLSRGLYIIQVRDVNGNSFAKKFLKE